MSKTEQERLIKIIVTAGYIALAQRAIHNGEYETESLHPDALEVVDMATYKLLEMAIEKMNIEVKDEEVKEMFDYKMTASVKSILLATNEMTRIMSKEETPGDT